MCPIKSRSQALTPASGKGDPVRPVGFRALAGSVQCGNGQCQIQGYRRTSPRLLEGDEEALKPYCCKDKLSPYRCH